MHIGIVNWVMSPWEGIKTLNGKEVISISPGLTEAVDVTAARQLVKNEGICFMGFTPGNVEFVVTEEQRQEILAADPASAEVIRPFLGGRDLNREVGQGSTRWIVDFGVLSKEEAERFPGAMRHVKKYVYPVRKENRREAYAERWWRFVEARPGLRAHLATMPEVLVLSRHSPALVIARSPSNVCFDSALMVITLSDPYHFGLLQSRVHSIWAWARGSTLKGDLRYTNTTIFETFPFPPLSKVAYDPRVRPPGKVADRVAKAGEAFDSLRSAASREQGVGFTKIHNQLESGVDSPVRAAYNALNDAVCAAYGFPESTWRDERETLKRLLQLNHELAGFRAG